LLAESMMESTLTHDFSLSSLKNNQISGTN
jgi:hypothetical protein